MNNSDAPFKPGIPLMEQTPAMPAHMDRLGHIAADALMQPGSEHVVQGTVVMSKSVDAGDVTHSANFVGSQEAGSRITVGENKKGIANGQRETTVAISGDINQINTVALSAAEATRIGSSLRR